MVLIYTDSQIADIEWVPHLRFLSEKQIVHTVREYEDTPADVKIAITTHRLYLQYDDGTEFNEKIKRLSAVSRLVFILESELHQVHWRLWEETFSSNNYWLVPGLINDRNDMAPHVIYWGDWFKTSALLYKRVPDKLALLEPYKVKPRMFDALLGCPKPHRTFVADSVKQYGLEDKFILTYGGAWDNDQFYAKDYFIWEDDCVPEADIIGTADWVQYCGHRAHLSQVIPIRVYNDTAYSIVAETDHNNTLSFFSEKTAKPFIARRLFVAFSGYKFLRNLRSLGFQTFSSIINEDYDEIFDDELRYAAAFEQVRLLCEMDQAEILERARPILEHNYRWIMDNDWNSVAIRRMQQIINQNLGN